MDSKMLEKVWKKREKQKAVLKNGAKLLEERLVTAFGRDNPVKIFSATQLQEAIETNKERNPCQMSTFNDNNLFKGILDDRMVLIKTSNWKTDRFGNGIVFRDIVVSSMMSSHRNVLKLIGCCLEFAEPVLVYENAEKGCLNSSGGIAEDGTVLSWKNRVKIAKEIASAVAYMHTSFPKRIIRRGIHPRNILVNQDYSAKLTDFSLAISIPEGEPNIEDEIRGTLSYIDPAYAITGLINEKTDVYSFGVLLLIFLTGKPITLTDDDGCVTDTLISYVERLLEEGKFKLVVDPAILENTAGIDAERHSQLKEFLELAQSCVKFTREDRPSMIQVAKELLRIERSMPAP